MYDNIKCHQLNTAKFYSVTLLTVVSVMAAASQHVELMEDEMTALDKINQATNKFAITLFRALGSKQPGNVFVSPLSVQMVLALAYTGAKGDTAKELAKLLELPANIQDTYVGYQSLIKVLQAPVLKIANSMFVEKASGIKGDFQENAEKYFQSPAEALDFRSNSEESRKHINAWVENRTNNKITNLLESGTIGSDTRLVLVNAIHFKADWASKFLEKDTREEPFHVSTTKTVNVKMMHTKKKFRFVHDEELKAKILQLGYKGGEFSMVIILPDDIDGLSSLEAKLEKVSLSAKTRYMEEPTVTVALPKFKLEETMELNDVLKSLGVKAMFDDKKADFSGLSHEPLVVSTVVQKAFVEVNEEGTEAAAATGLTISNRSLPPPSKKFLADHPFVFVIMNQKIPLFFGRIFEPPQ